MEYFVSCSGYLQDFSFAYYNEIEQFDIPNITYVGTGAFFNSKFVTKIHAQSATGVGKSAFHNCIKLYDVCLPNIWNMRSEAMLNCRNLETIDLQNVRKIGSKCFCLCSKLKNINLPEAVSIEEYAFHYCSQLEEINLPKVTVLEEAVFKNCVKLSRVIAPNVTKISKYVFSNCKQLMSLRLSNEITDDNIDYTSLEGCNNLISVYPLTNKMKKKIESNIDLIVDLYSLLPLLCIDKNEETDYNEIEDFANIMSDEVMKFLLPL